MCSGGEWRLKYERAIREIEFTKKRLQQEFDDKLEVEQQNKRQLERKVRASYKHFLYFNSVNKGCTISVPYLLPANIILDVLLGVI